MPIFESLAASPVALTGVFGNGLRYRVPPFQRDYAWGPEEWEELWADLVALARDPDPRARHYLGALVLQPTEDESERLVIDGQQRLVTLSLLALAVIAQIEALAEAGQDSGANRERARLLREHFVSSQQSWSLQHRPRLVLNQTDNPIFATYLVQGKRPAHPKAQPPSAQRLFAAFDWFRARLAEHFKEGASGATLAQFLEERLAPRLQFIQIVVQDEATAFTVFETLNARGVALGTADLLKNYLFSQANRGGRADLEQAQELWQQVVQVVPLERLSVMLFHWLAARVDGMREKRVFTEVKKLVPAQQDVFTFLRELKDTADLYAALSDPANGIWQEFPEARRSARLLDGLGLEQTRAVVLAAIPAMRERPQRVARLFEVLLTVGVRALTTRKNTGDAQRIYHQVARRIHNGELRSPHAVGRALVGLYGTDEEFVSALGTAEFRNSNKELLRLLLSSIEQALSGKGIDFEAGGVSVEHILPQNAPEPWPGFHPQESRHWVYRLGNLTPLELGPNRSVGASSYADKQAVYARSSFQLTREIRDSAWTPEAIRQRQLRMAEHAVRVWSLDMQGAGADEVP